MPRVRRSFFLAGPYCSSYIPCHVIIARLRYHGHVIIARLLLLVIFGRCCIYRCEHISTKRHVLAAGEVASPLGVYVPLDSPIQVVGTNLLCSASYLFCTFSTTFSVVQGSTTTVPPRVPNRVFSSVATPGGTRNTDHSAGDPRGLRPAVGYL